MTDGQRDVPLVVRAAQGAGRSNAAQHSQVLHAMVANIPGLSVVLPSSPYAAKGLLAASVRSPDPVIFLEDKLEYGRKGEVPEEQYEIPLGVANVVRPGGDVTIVATSSMVVVALAAAEELRAEGIDAEVVDPQTLVPLDTETILESVRRTTRAVVVDAGPRRFGAGAEIAALIAEEAFDVLVAPVARIGALDVPAPFNARLEQLTIPHVGDVVAAVRKQFAHVH
jgi:pyruvate dehydrogenase E1 component beta subunit